MLSDIAIALESRLKRMTTQTVDEADICRSSNRLLRFIKDGDTNFSNFGLPTPHNGAMAAALEPSILDFDHKGLLAGVVTSRLIRNAPVSFPSTLDVCAGPQVTL